MGHLPLKRCDQERAEIIESGVGVQTLRGGAHRLFLYFFKLFNAVLLAPEAVKGMRLPMGYSDPELRKAPGWPQALAGTLHPTGG